MDTIHKMDVSFMIISACKKFRSNYSNVEDRVFKFCASQRPSFSVCGLTSQMLRPFLNPRSARADSFVLEM